MSNKSIAWGLIISWSIGVLNAFSGDTENMYALAGIGALVFSIIAIVRLLRTEN